MGPTVPTRIAVFVIAMAVVVVMTMSDAFPHALWLLTERYEFLNYGSVSAVLDAGHAVVWAGIMIMTAFLLRGWPARVIAALALAVTGLALEVAQDHFSAIRTSSWTDVQANLAGLAVGLVIAMLIVPSPTAIDDDGT